MAELRQRFDPGGQSARGVHLMTYHRAKGLEFDAVFLPRLEEKELPTQARAHRRGDRRGAAPVLRRDHAGAASLALTWSRNASPFLAELGLDRRPAPASARPAKREAVTAADPELYGALAEWRKQRAKAEEVPAYIVFHNAVLAAIADAKPRSIGELAEVAGVGPTKLERYGDEVLEVVAAA